MGRSRGCRAEAPERLGPGWVGRAGRLDSGGSRAEGRVRGGSVLPQSAGLGWAGSGCWFSLPTLCVLGRVEQGLWLPLSTHGPSRCPAEQRWAEGPTRKSALTSTPHVAGAHPSGSWLRPASAHSPTLGQLPLRRGPASTRPSPPGDVLGAEQGGAHIADSSGQGHVTSRVGAQVEGSPPPRSRAMGSPLQSQGCLLLKHTIPLFPVPPPTLRPQLCRSQWWAGGGWSVPAHSRGASSSEVPTPPRQPDRQAQCCDTH